MDHLGSKNTAQAIVVRTDNPTGNPTATGLGYNCWTADPLNTQSARTPTLGSILLAALYPSAAVANGGTVNLECVVVTAGAGLTYARIGLYSYAAGTLTQIGLSADLSTNFTTTAVKSVPITLSAAIAPGDKVYVASLYGGTTSPAFAGVSMSYQAGRGTPVRTGALASQASLPASAALSSFATTSTLIFYAF